VQATIVGVVDNMRQKPPTNDVAPEVFVDFRQLMHLMEGFDDLKNRQDEWAIGFLSFAIRTNGGPSQAVPAVRQAVSSVDPNIGIDAILPVTRLVASSVARQRFYAVMLSVFASVAGLLAAIGVYGVLAYSIVQRTQEIGIRMALGARRRQVLGPILGRGAVLAAVGVSAGLVAAKLGSQWLQTLLFGVEPTDVWTYAAVGTSFALIAVLASYLPARRATRVNPVVALRAE
jgi:putative ABC transport system permease protein